MTLPRPGLWKVPLAAPEIDDDDRRAVLEALGSGMVALGPRTYAFERAFAEAAGVRYAVAVSSGTAALHLVLMALEVGAGHEVVLPSLTFVATANAVTIAGAQVVLADVDSREEPCLSAARIEGILSPRTRAVVAVHYAGVPCEMQALRAVCAARGVALIEDAAHAPGASLDGRPAGSLGDAGCFSFYANKNMTTIEGGMVTTDNGALAERVRKMRSHGMTVLSYERLQGACADRDVDAPGWNYRLDDVRSALGLSQLRRLGTRNERRRGILARYHHAVEGSEVLGFPFGHLRPGRQGVAHIAPLLVLRGGAGCRDGLARELEERGIQTSHHYIPVHRLSYYRRPEIRLPVTDAFADGELTLPLFAAMSDEQVDLVCGELQRAAEREPEEGRGWS